VEPLYTFAWLVWLGLFGVIEGFALMRKEKGDTLSEHIWSWFSVKGKGSMWRLRRFSLLAFLAWLVAHFLSGGRF
jgi:hypothetical protein